MRKKKTISKVKALYFLKYFADALYTPFLVLFLKSVGYKGMELGILLALVPIMAIAGNFVLSFLNISFKTRRNILTILLLIYGGGLIALSLWANNFILALIFVSVISFANGPSFNVEDGLSSEYALKEKKNYASIRLCGSIGYFVALLSLFFIPETLDYKWIFISSAALFIILAITWLFMPSLKVLYQRSKFKNIFDIKSFLPYFIMYILFFGAYTASETYLPSYLESVGVIRKDYSLFFAINVALEVIIISVLTKFIKKNHYHKVLYCSLGFLLLRVILLSLPNLNKEFLIFLTIIKGLGWGSFLAVHINLVTEKTNISSKSSAILLLCAGQGIIASILNFTGSNLIEVFSQSAFYFLISLVMSLAIIIYLIISIKNKAKKKELDYNIKEEGEVEHEDKNK